MSLPFSFHPAVRGEVDEAYRWYESRQPGLGSDFLDAVAEAQALIADNPALYGFAEGDIRAARLKRFPYALYYRVLNDRIRVLAVYHTARNPITWQSRT